MKGTYIIIAELDEAQDIKVGRRHRFFFKKGFYGYIGSALGSLESRLERHLKQGKPHWHIDYLLNHASIRMIVCAETSQKRECLVAQDLSRQIPSIKGFGSTDCKCSSHLFFCDDLESLRKRAESAFNKLSLEPWVIY